jgi:WD40 repeat protein
LPFLCSDYSRSGPTDTREKGSSNMRRIEWVISMLICLCDGLLVVSCAYIPKEPSTIECLGHAGAIHSIAFTPNGQYALSGSADGTIKLWEVETGQEVHSFSGHKDEVLSVALSPNGECALSGSRDGIMKLWRICLSGCREIWAPCSGCIRTPQRPI